MKKPLRPRVLVANWKMNPSSSQEAARIMNTLIKKVPRVKFDVVIVAPTLYTSVLRPLIKKPYVLGAQDAHAIPVGPHTGDVSARMLYAAGVKYVIVGHSERRAKGETDSSVNEKVRALIALRMTPIICIGETSRDVQGKYYSVVEAQLRAALSGVKKTDIEKVVIAYEPVWAISRGDGKGQTATPHDAHEMKLFIQKVLVEIYGRPAAMRVCVVYGGSVNNVNAEALMREGEVDGFLVGGASLVPDQFAKIAEAVAAV